MGKKVNDSDDDSDNPLLDDETNLINQHDGSDVCVTLLPDKHMHKVISKIDMIKSVASNSSVLTVFLLVNSMIGSGILNQPYVFMESGLLGGIFGFILGIIGTWSGLVLLTEAGILCNVFDYAKLSSIALNKLGEILVDYSIIFLAVGCQLGYLIVIGETSTQFIRTWGCTNDLICNQFNITLIEVIFFVTPLCLFRKFGHLAFISIISIVAIALCLFLVVIGGPIVTQHQTKSPIILFNLQGSITSLGSIVLALNCAFANFHAFSCADKQLKQFKPWVSFNCYCLYISTALLILLMYLNY